MNQKNVLQLKYTAVFLFYLLCSLNVYAQPAIIRGKLSDVQSREPLPFATVATKDGKKGTVCDVEGNYTLSLEKGAYQIVYSFVGYAAQTKSVTLSEGQELILNVSLLRNDSASIWKPIVITAGRLEQRLETTVASMDILPVNMVENRVDNNIETAVEQVPGVTVIDGQANIRGGSGFSYGAGSRVLVMVDDLPMLAADANDVKWSFIPVEQMEQTEVLKGASSALFGSSALNGVINMRTAMPGDTAETIINSFAGLYDQPADPRKQWWNTPHFSKGLTLSHRQKFGQLSVVTGGQYIHDDGYREGEREERFRSNIHLRYKMKNIEGLTVGIAVNAQRAKGGSFLIWQNDTTGALLPFGGTLSEYTSDRLTIDPYFIYSPGKWIHKLRTRYFYTGNVNNTAQGSISSLYYGEYLAQRRLMEKINITIGSAVTATRVEGELFDKQDGSNLSFFGQADGDFGKLQVSLGARMEQGKISGRKFDPQMLFRTGINYNTWRGGYARASYGQGFRFPSIAEQFVRTRVGDIVIYPNDSLIPEKGWSAEIGIKQAIQISSWRGLADVSVFRMEYQDMMEFSFGNWGNPATDPFFGLGFKSVNIGNTRIDGIEATIAGEGKIGSFRQTLLAGYTYIDPIQTDFVAARDTQRNSSDENVLKYRFRRMFKLDAETGYGRYFLGWSARYYSNIENIDRAFNEAIPGVERYRESQPSGNWIFDARFGVEVSRHIKCVFNVKNLFNEEFMARPADIQAPRSFVFSLVYKS